MATEFQYTRLVLRNDSTAAWLASKDQILLKGEVGVEFLEDGTPKIKIGDGVKTWEQLEYFGGESGHVFETEVLAAGANHEEAITALVGETKVVLGDIAIVKETITGDKVSYTAYVYNGTDWAAMDGNYSAKNVYFDTDLTLTQTFGKYAVNSSTPNVTIEAEGMSIYDLLMDAYSESKDPTKSNPKVTGFNVTGNGATETSFEIGTTVTPQWVSTFNAGSYTYKSSASNTTITPVSGTGVQATGWTVKQESNVIGSAEDGTASDSFVIGDGNTTAVSGTVNYSIAADYSNGNYALTNLNTLPKSEVRIAAGTTGAATDTLSWYRKMFGGGTSAETYTSDVIRGEAGVQAGSPAASTPWEFKAVAGDAKIFFAYPKAMTNVAPKFEIFTMAWGETSGFTSSEVQVNDAAGKNPMTYTVWTYAPAGGFVAEETKYRVYF